MNILCKCIFIISFINIPRNLNKFTETKNCVDNFIDCETVQAEGLKLFPNVNLVPRVIFAGALRN